MNPGDANFPMRIWSEAVVRGLLTSIWGMKVTGLERVPEDGPLLIASNHASNIDGPLLATAVAPKRRPWGVGKKELFSVPVLGWWLRETGSFPLDRKGDARAALKAGLDVLGRGGCVYMAPEGTRVKAGEKREPKTGIAFLARHSGARVLPVRLLGVESFPLGFPLEVRVGEPVAPPESDDREAHRRYTRDLMERIYSL